jgi:anthranilate synthase component 2
MKITVIDNYDSFVYNIVRYLRENDKVTEVCVLRNDELDFTLIEESDGILLSPGPGIPSEAGQLMDVLRLFSTSKSIFGVCLGHQAIGEFFGAKLEKAPQIYHGKATSIQIDNSSDLFRDLPADILVGRYHSWQVSQIPGSLKTIAFDEGKNVMAIEHRNWPVSGVQFHPESILTPHGRTIITNWINSIK